MYKVFVNQDLIILTSKIPFGKAELFSQNSNKESNELSINYKKEKHALQRRIIDLIK